MPFLNWELNPETNPVPQSHHRIEYSQISASSLFAVFLLAVFVAVSSFSLLTRRFKHQNDDNHNDADHETFEKKLDEEDKPRRSVRIAEKKAKRPNLPS